jgi:phosphotriesterase-related protein
MKKRVSILKGLAFTVCAFSQTPENWEGKVMTVKGPIHADSMGITLPHEHLLIVHKYNYLDLTNETDAINELGYFVNAGGKTLAEASPIGIGRNPEGLKRISEATGANVIMSAGYYKDMWIPDSIKNKSVGQLTEIITNDIINGINGIHAGFIKIAVSRPITPFEENALIAAARSQIATGVAIDVHFDGDLATTDEKHHVLDVFENEGVDLTRVYLSHAVPYIDLIDDFITLAQRGCNLSFDMLGTEVRIAFQHEQKLTETLNALISEGYLDQILISQDVCFSVCYVKNGGYGYANILNNILPKLKTSGITDEQIYTMMVENPKRLFPFKKYTNIGQCVNSTYTAVTGVISDNSGTSNYHNNMSCSKLIQPSNCSSVSLSFTAFDTELGNDVLSVYDGATTLSPLLGQYSGTTLPPVLKSTGGSMLIVFNTNGSNTSSGWVANYSGNLDTDYSGTCVNAIFTAESATITDNSGPSDYDNNMSCQKLIEVPGSASITLQFTSFATEPGYDLVKVYDGSTASSPLLGQYSGSTLPPVLTSTGGSMLIVFNTDNTTVASGWSANYTSNTISIEPVLRSVSPEHGATTFTIASNINWSVSESSDWLTATKSDANTLTVSYEENTSLNSRSAEITVSGEGVSPQKVMVNQSCAIPTLHVTPVSRSISPENGTTTFIVASNINWTVSESSGWLTATKTDANTLHVSYDSNILVDPRSAEITVSGAGVTSQKVMVNQSGAIPTLDVTPVSRLISPGAGTTTFTVASNINWSVSESSGWLTATKTDANTLHVSYDANILVDPRSAEITVGGTGITSQKVMVNQSGAIPTLDVTPVSRSVSPEPGTTTFSVASNINWSVSESLDWITATKMDANNLTISYDENTSLDSRSGEIIISGAGVSPQKVVVNQDGVIPALSVIPVSRSISFSPGSTIITVSSNINWSVSESSLWLTAIKTDANTLYVSYDENKLLDPRFAEITISAAGKYQPVYIIQEKAIPSNIKHISELQQINVFPNPASNKTSLTYSKGMEEIIEIYELSGEMIIRLQDSDKNGETEIDVSDLNSGLYIYRLIDNESNIYFGKILKE